MRARRSLVVYGASHGQAARITRNVERFFDEFGATLPEPVHTLSPHGKLRVG